MEAPRVIAIDGPGGSGKSTVSSLAARRLGFAHLDSGAVYRALAAWAMGESSWDPQALERVLSSGALVLGPGTVSVHGRDLTREIRTPEVSAQVWRVADLKPVRLEVNALLRRLAAAGPVVAEGRDMGTEAFPDAPLKVFLDADPEVRARRRSAQGTGETPEALAERVRRERERAFGGLRPAPDAVHLDATHHSAEEVAGRILELARERGLSGG